MRAAPGGLAWALAAFAATGGCAIDFNRYLQVPGEDAGTDRPFLDSPVVPPDDGTLPDRPVDPRDAALPCPLPYLLVLMQHENPSHVLAGLVARIPLDGSGRCADFPVSEYPYAVARRGDGVIMVGGVNSILALDGTTGHETVARSLASGRPVDLVPIELGGQPVMVAAIAEYGEYINRLLVLGGTERSWTFPSGYSNMVSVARSLEVAGQLLALDKIRERTFEVSPPPGASGPVDLTIFSSHDATDGLVLERISSTGPASIPVATYVGHNPSRGSYNVPYIRNPGGAPPYAFEGPRALPSCPGATCTGLLEAVSHPRSDTNVIVLCDDGARHGQVVSTIASECVLFQTPPAGYRLARLAVAR